MATADQTTTAAETKTPELNTSALKTFAQAARRQLLEQVEGRLDQVLAEGSLARRESEKAVADLEGQIASSSREQVIERVAYTWFNRFCALRFMDANRYTRLGTVSGAEGFSQPEILADAKQGVIDDQWRVDKERVLGLLDNTLPSDDPQGEAYRLLLVAVCNRHHELLPFMFEAIADYTELLLPADLLSENSVLTKTCEALTAEACQSVEVIGWLYQFYISEKKDEVIGKVVASEDIPAATQLFTPNWIVKYMVQNSLGAQWLATYPNSPLKGQMEYYIEPAEQTDEVNAQLASITPSQLNPEELTLIDPASGSGHILVEAYELFKAIYLERGYRQRDVPQLILEKNLFGLDIDERAAQLTGFALMMKGRADDRRLFERGVKLNVMALVDSAGFDAEGLANGVDFSDYELKPGDLTELKRLFEHATTFGSLIQVPEELAEKLPALKQLSEATSQDLFVSEALKRLKPLVQQAELLAAQYDSVVANPPYMGNRYLAPVLKKYLHEFYEGYEKDFFSAFIDRDFAFSKQHGRLGFMSPFVWMFISSHEHLRTRLINSETISTLVQLEYSGFEGATVPICTYTLRKGRVAGQVGCYIRLADFRGSENQGPKTLEALRNRDCGWFFEAAQDQFGKLPGSPVAYWVGDRVRRIFEEATPLGTLVEAKQGLATADNDQFLRQWFEVSQLKLEYSCSGRDVALASKKKWFPYNKGGGFRRWAGNRDYVVNWEADGREIRVFGTEAGGRPRSRAQNTEYYFRTSLSWSDITSGPPSFRVFPHGFIHDVKGMSAFHDDSQYLQLITAYCNTPLVTHAARALNPSLSFQVGNFQGLPFLEERTGNIAARVSTLANELCTLATHDWNAYERSWDFQSIPLLTASSDPTPTLESSYTAWITQNRDTIAEMKRLEEENNRLFIDAYGLADELTPDVPIEQITLTVNPAYRYGKKLTEEDQWSRFRQDTMEELASYAIGCMMGRYSLDKPGLILANTGETLEDYLKQIPEPTFMPDDDNVIPLVDGEWFTDEISERFKTFLKAAFGNEHYEQNLTYLEDGLFPGNLTGKKRKTIRDYFLKDFYSSHISTYKKRPIYWLFSSPKGTFGALIYMHRYRADTVSVVLGYLRDFQAKLTAEAQHLQTVADSADASQKEKAAALKQINNLKKDIKELDEYEHDVLYPLATEQVEIDLDDGVKVNYNKFGKALKKVTGLSGK